MEACLHQFLYSHFNEKARWALDYKGIPHQRQTYLPGPHMPSIRRLSGQTQTPVLTLGDEVIAGSAAIIDRLERDHPEPPLYPSDPALRTEALALQTRFDTTVGPAVRTALFSVLVHEGGYLTRMFARDASVPLRMVYRATFPFARRLIARANGVTDPENVRRAFETTERTLDEVADRSRATGYLCGTSFTVADLTAASLLAPLAAVDHPDMARPRPLPAAMVTFYDRWQDHPALGWLRHQYASHRP